MMEKNKLKRKLIQLSSSIVVSIPHEYVKEFNLNKKDEVEVNVDKNMITISTENIINGTKIVNLNVPEINQFILSRLYSYGIDKINVILNRNNSFTQLQKIIDKSKVDYEITFWSEKQCELESIKYIKTENFENLIRRIFLLLKQQQNTPDYKELVKRILAMCIRIIYKKGYLSHGNTLLMANFLHSLSQIIEFCKKIKFAPLFYELYYKYNQNIKNQLNNEINQIKNQSEKVLLRIFFESIVSLRMIYNNT